MQTKPNIFTKLDPSMFNSIKLNADIHRVFL